MRSQIWFSITFVCFWWFDWHRCVYVLCKCFQWNMQFILSTMLSVWSLALILICFKKESTFFMHHLGIQQNKKNVFIILLSVYIQKNEELVLSSFCQFAYRSIKNYTLSSYRMLVFKDLKNCTLSTNYLFAS